MQFEALLAIYDWEIVMLSGLIVASCCCNCFEKIVNPTRYFPDYD